MDIVQFKSCGTFLDGCKIFCSGFSERHLEKMRRIIVNAGGIHYWNLSDVVTHVVIGEEVLTCIFNSNLRLNSKHSIYGLDLIIPVGGVLFKKS